jgi:hypothetical protein
VAWGTHANTVVGAETVCAITPYPVALVAEGPPGYGLAERHIRKNGVPSGSRIAQGLMSW